MQTTIAPDEIEKFSRIADEWWDAHGKFAPLHKINPLRVQYIQERLQALAPQFPIPTPESPLKGIRLLDIGSGGGLISEPMAQLGANVTGIDASEKNIKVARLHAEKNDLNINYLCTTAEALLAQPADHNAQRPTPNAYDVVLALEIIEHVADVGLFVSSVMQLAKPGGLVVFSTINRTAKAYALAIIGAEYILRWLPVGTHDWNKFIRPSALLTEIEKNEGKLMDLTGMVMNPLTFEWSLNPRDVSVNYLMSVRKNS